MTDDATTPKYEPRRAPDKTWVGRTTDQAGESIELRADDKGVVWPRNSGEAAAADHFELPVARKALAELRATEPTIAATADKET